MLIPDKCKQVQNPTQVWLWADMTNEEKKKEKKNQKWIKKKTRQSLNTLEESRGKILFQTPLDINLEVFSRNGQGLYAWTPMTAYVTGDYNIKFGQYGSNATEGSTPQKTIKSYCGTTIDSIVILWAIRLSDEQVQKHGSAYKIEQSVKKCLTLSEYGKSTEIFKTDIDNIKTLTNDILYPQLDGFFRVKKNTYLPRKRQEEAIKKFKEYYMSSTTDSIDFLLGAVMRFGKNVCFLEMVRGVTKKGGNVLMITGRPDVFASLKEDVETHINYDNWIYNELKDIKYNWKPSTDKINVLAVSTQLLTNKKHRNKLVKMLSQYKWDIRGIDEADTVMMSELSTELLQKLPSKATILMSGTPWKLQSTNKFTSANSYIYDYVQQQKDKKTGIDKRAVSLDFYCLEVYNKITTQQKWYSDDEGFTLTKLFSWNKETERFIHEGDVRMFLECIFGKIPKTNFSPYKIIPEIKHTFWVLPPISAAVIRLKSLIEEITAGEYKVFAATASETDDISEVKEFLKLNGDAKSIVLSLSRFTRGSTVPEWDAVFMLNDTESAEYYFQTVFRPTSPREGKEKGYVFDFSPNRTLLMLCEYAYYSAQQQGITNPKKIIREYLDNFNIYGVDGGVEFKKKKLEDVLSVIVATNYTSNTLKTQGRSYINLENVNMSTRLLNMITELNDDKKSKHKVKISKPGKFFKRGKNYKSTTRKAYTEGLEKKNTNLIIRKISTLISKLPLICELGYTSVEDIIERLPNKLFLGATGSDKVILELLVNENIIDTYKINLQLINICDNGIN